MNVTAAQGHGWIKDVAFIKQMHHSLETDFYCVVVHVFPAIKLQDSGNNNFSPAAFGLFGLKMSSGTRFLDF